VLKLEELIEFTLTPVNPETFDEGLDDKLIESLKIR
jgi:hypothetical protein